MTAKTPCCKGAASPCRIQYKPVAPPEWRQSRQTLPRTVVESTKLVSANRRESWSTECGSRGSYFRRTRLALRWEMTQPRPKNQTPATNQLLAPFTSVFASPVISTNFTEHIASLFMGQFDYSYLLFNTNFPLPSSRSKVKRIGLLQAPTASANVGFVADRWLLAEGPS